MVELLTLMWLFNTSQPPQSSLTAQAPQAVFAAPEKAESSFTIKFTVDLKPFDKEKSLLDIPGVLNVRLRQHGPRDRDGQNYPAFKMPDGSIPVLEANLTLHSTEHPNWKQMTIGIPLAMLKKPFGKHDIVLNFSGPQWTIYVDGELLDNDFPFGYPQWGEKNTWKLAAEDVTSAEIFFPGIKPEKKVAAAAGPKPGIQYWLPPGHNNWVGDVATIFHNGRYHIFYLYDRRHHRSKFGCGAHYFEHISTKDFLTWTEHPAATPIEEQWECMGTGTPFVNQDKLCISYGMHTTRVYPREKTTLPAQWEYLNKHGRTGEFQRATTRGMPAGATYSVSADGVSNFKKSNVMFHPCENPSVYTDPSGKLRLLANFGAKGMWESEAVDAGWHCISPAFPPGGDCTFFFHWGKFDYIIGGFTGLWSKPTDAPNSAYVDVVRQGLDFYDGSNVPSISEISGGRFLMSSWIPIRGWGGTLVLRELIQFPDGRIGSKWMRETVPKTEPAQTLATSITETKTFPAGDPSFLLTFDVMPKQAKNGKLSISFLPESGTQESCELQIDVSKGRGQFGPGSLDRFAGQEKSLREGGSPSGVKNYAIEKLIGVDQPFPVRVIVKSSEKLGGAVIDAEIAGQRTMITYRADLDVKKMVFRTEGVELKKVQLAPLKN
ncbi:MAG: hypothetical protein K8T91_17170 [Planctomycetes bacterium]|nr:hypothetical protein [Planctomycetota bacterium]